MSNFMIPTLAVKQRRNKATESEINMGCESPPNTPPACLPERQLGNLERFRFPRSPFLCAYTKCI